MMLHKKKLFCVFLFLIIIINTFTLYAGNLFSASCSSGEIADTAHLYSADTSVFFDDIIRNEQTVYLLCKNTFQQQETVKKSARHTVYRLLKGSSSGVFSSMGICFLALSITVHILMRLKITAYTYKKDGKKRSALIILQNN